MYFCKTLSRQPIEIEIEVDIDAKAEPAPEAEAVPEAKAAPEAEPEADSIRIERHCNLMAIIFTYLPRPKA